MKRGTKITYGVIAVALITLAACSTTRYVPVETTRIEYRDREVEKIVTDSVLSERVVFIKGDTIVDIRERERIKTVEIHDTTLIERTDTITKVVEVERALSMWEQAKMDFGGLAFGALALAIGLFIYRLIRR